jgi:Uma2 family endonuclease
MTASASRTIALAEFLQRPETKPASEYINGEIIQKPMPKGRHSCLQGELCSTINRTANPQKVAHAFPELRCTFGNRSIVPDVAVFKWQHIPFDTEGQVLDNFNSPPDWTIEILSPEQKPNKVIGNVLYCLKHGAQLGWFIDPDDRSVLALLPGQQPELLQGGDSLPVLPELNLTLTVNQMFDWLLMGR